jgi:hypothetical protein
MIGEETTKVIHSKKIRLLVMAIRAQVVSFNVIPHLMGGGIMPLHVQG